MSILYADNWGSPEYALPERGIISRKGPLFKPGGVESIPVSIMLSPSGIKTYDRSIAGESKAYVMNEAFGDWVLMRAPEFREMVRKGLTITWVSILFGARAFNFLEHFNETVSQTFKPRTIVLKNQRKPSGEGKSGWEISCWGFAPDFECDSSFIAMSEEEKKKYPFVSKEQVLKTRGIEYFESDVLVISEGAGASGETIESTLLSIFATLREAGRKLPQHVYVYINFSSTLTAFRAARVCMQHGVNLSFTFMGSAISVSPRGLLPGLPYTDLSHLDPGSVTYERLYHDGVRVCTDLDGKTVFSRCSCGDVGDSLDNPFHYYTLLVLENLILRIPLHRENLMGYYGNPHFVRTLKEEIMATEKAYGVLLKNTLGERVLDIVNRHQQHLTESQGTNEILPF